MKLDFPPTDFLLAESIQKMKEFVDQTPDKWLKYQLDHCLQMELYEVAAYIKEVAAVRQVAIS